MTIKKNQSMLWLKDLLCRQMSNPIVFVSIFVILLDITCRALKFPGAREQINYWLLFLQPILTQSALILSSSLLLILILTFACQSKRRIIPYVIGLLFIVINTLLLPFLTWFPFPPTHIATARQGESYFNLLQTADFSVAEFLYVYQCNQVQTICNKIGQFSPLDLAMPTSLLVDEDNLKIIHNGEEIYTLDIALKNEQ